MPTNANVTNSRVTSEALEKKFRDVFPAQGGAELVQDLYASGVIQPVIDFSSVSEGSVLSQNLQTAWDFSTGTTNITATGTTTLISNPGFWKVENIVTFLIQNVSSFDYQIQIYDGSTPKTIYRIQEAFGAATPTESFAIDAETFTVFLRTGDILRVVATESPPGIFNANVFYRQIADVNGNLVNPLGFTSS